MECPNDLYHPVLPVKKNNRLMFDLTPKYFCMFTNIELRKAIQLGYEITEYHECFYWSEEKTKKGLFKGYVNMWLKIKQQAAGFKDAIIALIYFGILYGMKQRQPLQLILFSFLQASITQMTSS